MPNMTILASMLTGLALLLPVAAQGADVEQVYTFYCAQCHGLEGKGDGPNVTKDFATDPRNFTNSKEMAKLSDADMKNVIMDGGPSASKSALMPPWGKTIEESEADALVVYLRKICNCKGKGS